MKCSFTSSVRVFGLFSALVFGQTVSADAAQSDATNTRKGRPNIILIMSDDMGYSDIGCYGGEINTPVLDGLAKGGVRFTQFYNTARCCPTRASLLTGLYPHSAGIGHMMNDRGLEGYRGDLNKNCQTIAEVLRPAGYRTYMSGKWHVTKKVAPNMTMADKHNWPLQRGFDRFFGTIHGAGSFYDPNSLTIDNTQVAPGNPGFFYTDAISNTAARYISDHTQYHNDQPFFMYVMYTATHWPMHARPHNIAKYKGKYDKGWDAIRKERYERMVKMGIIDKRWAMSPRDGKASAWIDAKEKEWEAKLMEVYAAMLDCMDQGIGRIVETLKATGQYDNTLILFFADNGGCAEGMGRRGDGKNPAKTTPNGQRKPLNPRDLQTSMIPPWTRDGRKMRQGRNVMPGPADTYHGYGLAWANASNTPFKEYKHWVHEGGIATPLVAHWPKGIDAARHGKLEHQPAHLVDLMATAVDLGKATYPKEVDGKKIHPLAGVSLKPALNGESVGRKEPIFWEHEGNRALRDGKWKLVAKGARGAWELYDLDADRTELNNLAAKHPDRTQAMADQWEAMALRFKAKPWIWGPKNNNKKHAK